MPAQALQTVKVAGSQMAGSQQTSEGYSPPDPENILPSKDMKIHTQKNYAFLISHYHHFIKLKVSMKSSHSNWVQLVLGKAHYFVMRHHNLGSQGIQRWDESAGT